jgi:hypothetical protein
MGCNPTWSEGCATRNSDGATLLVLSIFMIVVDFIIFIPFNMERPFP